MNEHFKQWIAGYSIVVKFPNSNMNKYLINSPIFYVYIIFYLMLFNAKGRADYKEFILGVLLTIFFSFIGTKLAYLVIHYIRKHKSNVFYKILLIISLPLSVLGFIFLSLYSLSFIDILN